jgi:hypothetical protein
MIKIKTLLDDVYESQKYVISTASVKSSLKKLRASKEYKTTSVKLSILLENFTLIAEWISLKQDDVYPFIQTGRGWFSFIDRNKIQHEIRLTTGKDNRYEVKIWFVDDARKPNYSPPNIYNNIKYDTRIFNTHIFILINKILSYFFGRLSAETLYLPATDSVRYRLYRIALNNHLDKTKYELTDLGNNTLSIKKKL